MSAIQEIVVPPGDARAIQRAIDELAQRGGRTVRLSEGVHILRDAIHLRDNIELIGAGPTTILRPRSSRTTRLIEDSDGYQNSVVVENADGFDAGGGVVLHGKCPRHGRRIFNYHRIFARNGSRITLDRRLGESYWLEGGFMLTSIHPIILGRDVRNCRVADLRIEGLPENDKLLGEADGAVSFIESSHIRVSGVEVRGFNGSAFSWQTTGDFDIRDCAAVGCTELGLHPGGGAPRSVIENNRVQGGVCGVFLCWGVTDSIVRGNTLVENEYGVSLGHRDTDNLIEANRIERSTRVGLRFRDAAGQPQRNAHRNRIIANRFIDCGPDVAPLAVDLRSAVQGIELSRNVFKDARRCSAAIGVAVGAQVRELTLSDNSYEGFAVEVEDACPRS